MGKCTCPHDKEYQRIGTDGNCPMHSKEHICVIDPDFRRCTICGMYPGLTEGAKNDSDKIRMELLSTEALRGTAKVLTFGAKKYDDRNWEKGILYSKVYGALLRHITAWFGGEEYDFESGLRHLDHAGCCIMFLQAYAETGMDKFDDRPGTIKPPYDSEETLP